MASADWLIENEKDGSLLLLIPGGEFLAGEDKFKVFIPDYYLSLHPVTNAQYARLLSSTRPKDADLTKWIELGSSCFVRKGASGYEAYGGKDGITPMVKASWYGAKAYCEWAGLRLPTELEWEKGSRGTDGRTYPWGNDKNKGSEQTSKVYGCPDGCSPWGLYQMSGNVWEWCEDVYDSGAYNRYKGGDLSLPKSSETGARVLRGGSCLSDDQKLFQCAYRSLSMPTNRYLIYGFRGARTPG